MKLLDKILSFFKKEEKKETPTICETEFSKEYKNNIQEKIKEENLKNCPTCPIADKCNGGRNNLCQKYQIPEGYGPNKKTILIIDDNLGIVSFLEDDVKEMAREYSLNIDDFNIVAIYGNDAAINAITLVKKYPEFKVDYAIIDLTYGAIIKTDKGNVKFNGVDVFCYLREKNPNLKYVFFTGNTLNTYLNSIKRMVEKFKSCSNGEDIIDHTIFKNQYSDEDRLKVIFENLFKEK